MRRKFTLILIASLFIFVSLACRFGANDTLVFTPNQFPSGKVGQPFDATITVTNNSTPVGGFTVSSGNLPNGLSLQFERGQDSAKIVGTPRKAGTFNVEFSIWCFGTNRAGQTGVKDYQFTIAP